MLGNNYMRFFLVFVISCELSRIASFASAVHATREILRQIFFSRLLMNLSRDICSYLPFLLLGLVLLIIQLPRDGLRLLPRFLEFGLQLRYSLLRGLELSRPLPVTCIQLTSMQRTSIVASITTIIQHQDQRAQQMQIIETAE